MKKTYMKPEMAIEILNATYNLLAGSGVATNGGDTSVNIKDTGATGEAEANSGSFWDDED